MDFSRLLRSYGLVALGLVLVVIVLHLAFMPRGMHLTEAGIMIQATNDYPPPPSRLDQTILSGAWQTVSLPNASMPRLETQLASDPLALPTQTTWYRVELPRAVLPDEAGYLYIPRWKSDGELAVYINGQLQYQSHANHLWNGSNRPLRIAFDNTRDAEPVQQIVLRLQHLRGIGGALSSLWVGDFGEVGLPYLVRSFFQAEFPYIVSAAFLVCGVFALFFWVSRRDERLYLLFFVMSVVNFIRVMHNYMGLERLPISDPWFGWLTVNSLLWMIGVVHLFLTAMHQQPARALNWIVGLSTLVLGVITCPLLHGTLEPTLSAFILYVVMFLLANMVAIAGLRASRRARSAEATALTAWVFFITYLGIYDLLLQQNLVNIEGYFLVPYAQIAIVIGSFHAIINRYTSAVRDVERSNLVMAERLAAREAELLISHQKVREIEQRELIHQERQRLMEDMHDGLGSSLVSALRMVERGKLDEVEIAQILEGCIEDLKLTIDSMEPVETDLLLLLGTLRFRLQPRLESTGIKLRWDVSDVPALIWLDQRHSLHILRILQETFTNIIKHAGASEAWVATEVSGDHVIIRVTDNGRGADLDKPSTGRGFNNQARRANAIGGSIDITSDGSGTSFELRLPIEQGAASNPSARLAEPASPGTN